MSLSVGSVTGKLNKEDACDWQGQMTTLLQQGWRLVEIFFDQSSAAQGHGFSATQAFNSVWFFEKEASRIDDPRPVYEGTVIEYEHMIEFGFAKLQLRESTVQWDSVLSEMGKRGWELACILETPAYKMSTGLSKMKMKRKFLMFFQRKLPGI